MLKGNQAVYNHGGKKPRRNGRKYATAISWDPKNLPAALQSRNQTKPIDRKNTYLAQLKERKATREDSTTNKIKLSTELVF